MSRAWLGWAALAAALLAIGIALGEPAQVLLNGAGVCLSCMGIG